MSFIGGNSDAADLGIRSFTSADRARRAERLRDLVFGAVAATSGEGILLSGGLDTSIIARVAAVHGRRLHALTVSVADGNCLDEPYATQLAARLDLTLETLRPRLTDRSFHWPCCRPPFSCPCAYGLIQQSRPILVRACKAALDLDREKLCFRLT